MHLNPINYSYINSIFENIRLLKKGPGLGQFFFESIAFVSVFSFFIFMVWGVRNITLPLHDLSPESIDLSLKNLPMYALETTLRMFVAVFFSLVFTLIYANFAAKNHRLGQILIPLLDIFQSVPILGYISFTVTGFLALFPGSMLGPECAAIFAIFSSQAWNMTFSLYQSIRTTPQDLCDAAFVFNLSSAQKFWRLELPFAMPGLIWNTMMSMSGGWFFVVAAEAISVGNQTFLLPGIGSYIAVAIKEMDFHAIEYAIGMMGFIIFLYNQFIFSPLIAWSNKFRYEEITSTHIPHSWVLTIFQRSLLIKKILSPLKYAKDFLLSSRVHKNLKPIKSSYAIPTSRSKILDLIWYIFLTFVGIFLVIHIFNFLQTTIGWNEVLSVTGLAFLTLLRIIILIILASMIWVPIGIYIGLRPHLTERLQPLTQFLSSFPANLLFPIFVIGISLYGLNPNIWLSLLMILGTQWYILFNVIAGASQFPTDLQDAANNLNVKGWSRFSKIFFPGVFPYFITGAITASGGAWNASIVAEFVSWGNQNFTALGLGSYIAEMTLKGDFTHIALGVGMMAFIVVLFNRFFWRPLYEKAVKNYRF